jgi:ABC-type amino acid transport system permease subunit
MNKSEQINFQELFENIQKDSSLLSTINVNELLKIVKDDTNSTKYLLNKTATLFILTNSNVIETIDYCEYLHYINLTLILLL